MSAETDLTAAEQKAINDKANKLINLDKLGNIDEPMAEIEKNTTAGAEKEATNKTNKTGQAQRDKFDADYQFEIGEGVAFASEFIPDLQEVNYQILDSLPQETLRDLYVFDYWIKNADRNLTVLGGNPNLFYAQSNLAVKVLDHNLAFDDDFLIQEHQQLHVSSDYWPAQIDYCALQNYERRMGEALLKWQELVAQIPEDWQQGAFDYHGIIQQMALRLKEYLDQEFWEGLK